MPPLGGCQRAQAEGVPGTATRPLLVRSIIGVMWQPRAVDRLQADFLALQAARAGCALACPYSSSDEFEAAIIRSKLDAGVYGPKRRRRRALYAGMAAAAIIVLLLML
jgi:hypothetical protein